MVRLEEFMDTEELITMYERGYVRQQKHPYEDLVILNYTNKAQFDNEWNDVTEQTRGLIARQSTREVVSRPFRKFFNWEQLPPTVQADLLNQPVEVYMKWDGSLGILYGLHTGESAIATRGSFTSPQAQHATEVLREKYPTFEPILGLTYLFEIIYPENRIVLDYQGMDDLVLLAVIDTETGDTLPSGPYDWPGPINRPVEFMSLKDVLAAPQVENQEGFVFHFPSTGQRVKFKFDQYKALHGVLTETSTLTVWNALATGAGIDSLIEHVPDEFYTWVKAQVGGLRAQFAEELRAAEDEYEWITRHLKRPEEDAAKRRKEFALLANESPYRDVLFGLYDGKDTDPRIWKRIKPEYCKAFWNQGT